MADKNQGIKLIEIHARCTYPIVSAFEFEFLKSEQEVQALLKPCTLYIIAQRPLVYFSNLHVSNGVIHFSINDFTDSAPLRCSLDPVPNGFAAQGEDILVDMGFYRQPESASEPFDAVAGFKLKKINGDFMIWLTPQKFIHHVLMKQLDAVIEGDALDYTNYHVHYIGQAFSQDIWRRLTGHEKMQSILTQERPLDGNSDMSSFEISLMLIDILGFDDVNVFPSFDFAVRSGVEPIVFDLGVEDGDEAFERYLSPLLTAGAPELTNEVEALLVSEFRPKYNKVLFGNYPYIARGTRSVGYTDSYLVIQQLPASLSTESFKRSVVLPAKGAGPS